jgi:O-antigen ligase
MTDTRSKNLIVLLGGVLVLGFLLLTRPGYFADYSILGTLILAELLFFAVIKYRQVFFPLLIIAFLGAGIALPYRTAFLYGRWFVLGAGAVAGLTIYMRERNHYFGMFHLVALFCVLSAIVSALVSAYPEEAILKALSLTLLFVYAASGARASLAAIQPEIFFRKLIVGCEILTVFTAVSYLLLRWQFFGNPNSLGAVMGVAIIPIMLWGFITAQTALRRRRLAMGLIVAALLLMSSFARAAIGAAAISCFLVCVGLRQYRLLAKSFAATVVLAIAAAMLVPQPTDTPQYDGSAPVGTMFLYKGHPEGGVLASRRGVWEQTWDVIKENPWFGSGFGTSVTADDMTKLAFAKTHVDSWVIREHGNSYLGITEWVGLLGMVPFYSIILLTARNVRSVFSWMRRTGDGFSPAVPAAAVVTAGLVHAAFEDWMFAVGYYLCVFFWAMAFILVDVLPRPPIVYVSEISFGLSEQQLQGTPVPSAL